MSSHLDSRCSQHLKGRRTVFQVLVLKAVEETMFVGDQKRKFVCLEIICFASFLKQWCFILDYSECSKCYRIYNIETLIVDESINIWFDDKLVSDETKQLKNFCRYSFILSEAAEQRSESPEAVYIRSNGSEDHSDLHQHTSEGVFPEEKLDQFRSSDRNQKA